MPLELLDISRMRLSHNHFKGGQNDVLRRHKSTSLNEVTCKRSKTRSLKNLHTFTCVAS
jgi:hypothetical protein